MNLITSRLLPGMPQGVNMTRSFTRLIADIDERSLTLRGTPRDAQLLRNRSAQHVRCARRNSNAAGAECAPGRCAENRHIGRRRVLAGRYTVYLRAKYGDAGQELYSQEKLWVVPWRTQGWKLLLGLGLVVWVIVARRRFRAFWIVLKTGLPPKDC